MITKVFKNLDAQESVIREVLKTIKIPMSYLGGFSAGDEPDGSALQIL